MPGWEFPVCSRRTHAYSIGWGLLVLLLCICTVQPMEPVLYSILLCSLTRVEGSAFQLRQAHVWLRVLPCAMEWPPLIWGVNLLCLYRSLNCRSLICSRSSSYSVFISLSMSFTGELQAVHEFWIEVLSFLRIKFLFHFKMHVLYAIILNLIRRNYNRSARPL